MTRQAPGNIDTLKINILKEMDVYPHTPFGYQELIERIKNGSPFKVYDETVNTAIQELVNFDKKLEITNTGMVISLKGQLIPVEENVQENEENVLENVSTGAETIIHKEDTFADHRKMVRKILKGYSIYKDGVHKDSEWIAEEVIAVFRGDRTYYIPDMPTAELGELRGYHHNGMITALDTRWVDNRLACQVTFSREFFEGQDTATGQGRISLYKCIMSLKAERVR